MCTRQKLPHRQEMPGIRCPRGHPVRRVHTQETKKNPFSQNVLHFIDCVSGGTGFATTGPSHNGLRR